MHGAIKKINSYVGVTNHKKINQKIYVIKINLKKPVIMHEAIAISKRKKNNLMLCYYPLYATFFCC